MRYSKRTFRQSGVERLAGLINFKRHSDGRGTLVAIEGLSGIPFAIRRVFYIYGMAADEGEESVAPQSEGGGPFKGMRGCHANRRSEFVLISVAGSCKVRTDDGEREEEFTLKSPDVGLYIPRMVWKEMYGFSRDAVLLALSSEAYDPEEYIKDKEQYYKEVGGAI